jgi:hypothetical protein
MHDRQSREWVFPALSRSGHVEEIKGTSWVNGKKGERRKIVRLTKVGHSLRHSYRTLCAAAGLDRLRTKLLTIQNELIRGRRRQFLPGPSHRQVVKSRTFPESLRTASVMSGTLRLPISCAHRRPALPTIALRARRAAYRLKDSPD